MSWKSILKDSEEKKPELKVPPSQTVAGWDAKNKKIHIRAKEKREREKEAAKTKNTSIFDFGGDVDKQQNDNEELPEFRGNVTDTTRWMKSRRHKILEASMSDEDWSEFTNSPEVVELIENNNSFFVRDVEFVKRLITEDTINSRGKTFKSLKEMLGARTADMSKRLDTLGKPKKTSQGNIRETTEEKFRQLINGNKWEIFFKLLKDKQNKVRFKMMISRDENLQLRNTLIEKRPDEYRNEVAELLYDGKEKFDSYSYTGNIEDSQIIEYISYMISKVNANNTDKNSFIDLGKSRSNTNTMNFIFHSSRGIHPALEFILKNEAFDTSAMVKHGTRSSSVVDRYLINRLKTSKEGAVKVPATLRDAYDLSSAVLDGAGGASKLRMLEAAKKRGDNAFLETLRNIYGNEMKEFSEGVVEMMKDKSTQNEQGEAYRFLLEDIEGGRLGDVNDALGQEISREEFNEKKDVMIEAVKNIIAGTASDEQKTMFPETEKRAKKEHPFDSTNFTRKYLFNTVIGIRATPADIVKMLHKMSVMVGGGLTKIEIQDYFSDLEKAESLEEEMDIKDKFLDEIRRDYDTTRPKFLERIKNNMLLVLKEGMKLNVQFSRRGDIFEYLEPYLFLKKLLNVRD